MPIIYEPQVFGPLFYIGFIILHPFLPFSESAKTQNVSILVIIHKNYTPFGRFGNLANFCIFKGSVNPDGFRLILLRPYASILKKAIFYVPDFTFMVFIIFTPLLAVL